jgi:2-octaprenyl-6-methoxyphenol hydroxylase
VHPVAGQGFNLGLRDVAALAEVIEDALAEGADIASVTVLKRYANGRVRDNQVTARFTDGLIRLFSNDLVPLALGRNLGLIAADLLPPVKRGFIRMTSGLAGRQPRLARGLPTHNR